MSREVVSQDCYKPCTVRAQLEQLVQLEKLVQFERVTKVAEAVGRQVHEDKPLVAAHRRLRVVLQPVNVEPVLRVP